LQRAHLLAWWIWQEEQGLQAKVEAVAMAELYRATERWGEKRDKRARGREGQRERGEGVGGVEYDISQWSEAEKETVKNLCKKSHSFSLAFAAAILVGSSNLLSTKLLPRPMYSTACSSISLSLPSILSWWVLSNHAADHLAPRTPHPKAGAPKPCL